MGDQTIQSKGGDARAAKLTAAERKQIARKAAESRWGADLPQASHDGPLHIGDAVLIAANLPNGKRLLSQTTMLTAIGRSPNPPAGTGVLATLDGLPSFLRAEVLKPFISEELMLSTTPIHFKLKNGTRTVGYDAMLLPMVCEVYLRLRDHLSSRLADGDAAEKRRARSVLRQYKHIVEACDRLTRGLARRGIIALIDDATGYQADKAREEVQRIIQAYVAPALVPWTRKFPHEFFREVYRLLGWEYRPGQIKHPQYMGRFINKYVYEALPPGVLDELKRRLPKNEHGNRRAKLWQLLTVDTGSPHLDKQLTADITLMQVSDSKAQFEDNFEKVFGMQPRLPFGTPTKELKG
ncbi:MAG TPA: P63C domain-containing protein [Candidatus Acidoferrum sp.]|nr:P63C domain-containing protein [Candidatus Acidoferrum sp.]